MVKLIRTPCLVLITILITISSLVLITNSKSIVSKVKEMKNEIKAGHDLNYESPTFLTRMITHIFEAFNLKQVLHDIKISKTTDATCHTCKFGIGLLQHLLEFGKSKEEVAHLALSICTTLKVESPRVCKGIVESYRDELIMVIAQLTITPSEICGIILGDTCAHVYNPLYNWTLPLSPIPKPPINPLPIEPASPIQAPPGGPRSKKTLRVLQLSDTHIDLEYAQGGDAVCGEPLCCRESSREGAGLLHERHGITPDERAGYWGDYRDCDIPLRTLESMLASIQTNHPDLDLVFWTGDVPAHDIWNQTRSGQISLIRTVSNLMTKYLGHIPILPALGNHESAPVNSFPRPEVKGHSSIDWLYSALDDIWSKWLPDSTRASIKKGAYYAIKPREGLKIISLNMNYCNNQNWWLLLNSTDPADELTWLINELQSSELTGEHVLIIGHIPPGSNDCLQVWSSNYYRIVNRYESTIAAQFFGHTHQDEFQLFYEEEEPVFNAHGQLVVENPWEKMARDAAIRDFGVVSNSGNPETWNAENRLSENQSAESGNSTHEYKIFESYRPTSVAYIGPSATTFGGVNPGYRIYTLDGETFQVIDHETYYANLTEANEEAERRESERRREASYHEYLESGEPSLKFELSYRAREMYKLSTLSPAAWHHLIIQMVSDEELFKSFETLFYNRSDTFKRCSDSVCKADILCRLISGKAHDYNVCQKFLKDLDILSNNIDGSAI